MRCKIGEDFFAFFVVVAVNVVAVNDADVNVVAVNVVAFNDADDNVVAVNVVAVNVVAVNDTDVNVVGVNVVAVNVSAFILFSFMIIFSDCLLDQVVVVLFVVNRFLSVSQ